MSSVDDNEPMQELNDFSEERRVVNVLILSIVGWITVRDCGRITQDETQMSAMRA